MTINKANPNGWKGGDILTPQQINDIDSNASSMVDGRAGQSDTVESTINYKGPSLTFKDNEVQFNEEVWLDDTIIDVSNSSTNFDSTTVISNIDSRLAGFIGEDSNISIPATATLVLPNPGLAQDNIIIKHNRFIKKEAIPFVDEINNDNYGIIRQLSYNFSSNEYNSDERPRGYRPVEFYRKYEYSDNTFLDQSMYSKYIGPFDDPASGYDTSLEYYDINSLYFCKDRFLDRKIKSFTSVFYLNRKYTINTVDPLGGPPTLVNVELQGKQFSFMYSFESENSFNYGIYFNIEDNLVFENSYTKAVVNLTNKYARIEITININENNQNYIYNKNYKYTSMHRISGVRPYGWQEPIVVEYEDPSDNLGETNL